MAAAKDSAVTQLRERIAALRKELERETDAARAEQLRYWIAALELELEEAAT